MAQVFNIIAIVAAFAAMAAALYLLLSFVIRKLDARYERHSGDSRRKNLG